MFCNKNSFFRWLTLTRRLSLWCGENMEAILSLRKEISCLEEQISVSSDKKIQVDKLRQKLQI